MAAPILMWLRLISLPLALLPWLPVPQGDPAPARVPRPPLSAPVPAEQQIFWQRSLADAQALSTAQGRPILVAVNMDGESASENIVRERYRDPKFVALTRRFVCLGASAFRHGERDHAFDGTRVPSPRLGEITSGEAMALEPVLFERFLGGERVAPRHALILPDGTKHFDLYRLFDLRDLDQALADAQSLAPEPTPVSDGPTDAASLSDADWRGLAAGRDARERTRFENLLRAPAPVSQVESALRAIAEVGDGGGVEALRVALGRSAEAPGRIVPACVDAALARGFAAELASAVREGIMDVPEGPVRVGLGARLEWLEALAQLDGAGASSRSLILSYAVSGSGEDERGVALGALAAPDLDGGSEALAAAIETAGGPLDPARVLTQAAAIPRGTPWRADDSLATPQELEAELEAADQLLSLQPADPRAQVRFGRAALTCARSRLLTGGAAIDLLLTDAAGALERAARALPGDPEPWLLWARCAYLRSDFAAEETAALGALGAAAPLDPAHEDLLLGRAQGEGGDLALAAEALAGNHARLEALRWQADASARLVASRSGGDLATEAAGLARGLRAAALAALSPNSTPTDWLTFSAIHAALGRRAEEIAIARAALEFFPEDQELRGAFYRGLWDRGWTREARRQSEELAQRHGSSAAARWYVGYAAMREGDSLRRAEDPQAALAAYGLADAAFQASARMEPGFQDSADHYRALAALGSGFAHLLVDERAAAAEALIRGIAIRPSIADVRDALDREAVDLLDGALEWRLSGESPVDPASLARSLGAADPGNTRWARSISDSELREGLRADGRKQPARGDRHMLRAIEIARLAQGPEAGDEDRRALAQALTVEAERRLARADFESARPRLAEALLLLGERPLASGASDGEWVELVARLRGALGDARPVFRPGR
jgi:hypothetical protein